MIRRRDVASHVTICRPGRAVRRLAPSGSCTTRRTMPKRSRRTRKLVQQYAVLDAPGEPPPGSRDQPLPCAWRSRGRSIEMRLCAQRQPRCRWMTCSPTCRRRLQSSAQRRTTPRSSAADAPPRAGRCDHAGDRAASAARRRCGRSRHWKTTPLSGADDVPHADGAAQQDQRRLRAGSAHRRTQRRSSSRSTLEQLLVDNKRQARRRGAADERARSISGGTADATATDLFGNTAHSARRLAPAVAASASGRGESSCRQVGYDPIGTVQQAITTPADDPGAAVPRASATGCSCRSRRSSWSWHGIRMMLAWRESGEHMFSFAKLMLVIAFGYAMIAYYESPIPGHR